MSSVAPDTVGTAIQQDERIQPEDWPEEINQPYSRDGDRVLFSQDGLDTGVKVLGDGRLDIHINEHKPSIAGLLNQLGRTPLPSDLEEIQDVEETKPAPEEDGKSFPLQLNIVIQIIGSRGDIQPFVALGKELKTYGHRVRLATHLAFRDFVNESDLEFFDIGGDPAELMAFMVKNPGLIPDFKTIRSGAIQKRRREMNQIIHGCWKSCFETGDGTHLHQIKDDPWSDSVDYRRRSFVADAIIANPPSLAHIHCAQRLGIPLHIMFTMPWSPTQAFPHPLAIVHHQNCKPTVANFVSYAVVDMMVWEGLGDLVNKFRKTCLSLDPLDTITAPSLINRLQIPCAYLWSPALLAKPRDWAEKIDICGFSFLPTESDYTPPEDIEAFLRAGPEPIYVGFGSIVVDDQIKLTKTVFEAIRKTGQRALVSKGWGNLGIDDVDVPENILIIGSCPHDWLFRQVSVVIHHGGAGTTAAGLALGKPTIIIPFFGDQQFWGSIVARAGAGPIPIPHKQLTVDKLSEAIEMALKPSTQKKAQIIGDNMRKESGVRDAARSFHKHLNLRSLRCAICPSRPAVWHLKRTDIQLSAFAGSVLVEMGRIKPEEVVLHRPMEYDTYRDPVGPLSAGAQVLFGAIANFLVGLADVPTEIVTDVVSTGRALGHPHDHSDPRSGCRLGRLSPREESESDEEQNEEGEIEDRMGSDQGSSIDEDEQEDPAANGDLFDPTLERKDSLQLQKQQTMSSEMEKSKPHNVFSEAAIHGSIMSMKFVNLVIWLPTDLSLSLAKGFHNAPKLYHDPTVKRIPTVTGIHSGFRAAGSEFKDGFYYGVTGLVTHPRFGYKRSGTKGLFKGVGKGVGGVVFKVPAGLWGLAGYPLAGLRRRLLESIGRSQQCQIIKSRITQGHEEMRASTAEERTEVARRWIVIEEELEKARKGHSRAHVHRHGHHH